MSKWHYFHEEYDICRLDLYSNNPSIQKKEYITACYRNINMVKQHTELKSQVTCLKCLKRINNINNKKGAIR